MTCHLRWFAGKIPSHENLYFTNNNFLRDTHCGILICANLCHVTGHCPGFDGNPGHNGDWSA